MFDNTRRIGVKSLVEVFYMSSKCKILEHFINSTPDLMVTLSKKIYIVIFVICLTRKQKQAKLYVSKYDVKFYIMKGTMCFRFYGISYSYYSRCWTSKKNKMTLAICWC